MKVFGIGLNKTGTTTLGQSLEILGFENHVSCNGRLVKALTKNDYSSIYETAEINNNFEDWPWPLVYKKMYKKYPDAKFVLTVRESPEIWYNSLCKHAERTGPKKIRKRIYGYYMPHYRKREHISFYERHNQAVVDFFAQNAPENLIVVCWEKGQNWKELCNLLNKPVPEVEFPFLNKATDKTNEVKKAKVIHNSIKRLVFSDRGAIEKLSLRFLSR
ncbi:hypothetical protein GM418_01920 [Maribellus comscasis]|uniref:Sulfotransferase family protein n=1 Tax=Maribellus comscasis TaxID=2681766 RepID=A0A6I6JQF9_9BACT|nr:sulfotransferase family protein [Maribellus comscasis]QGY42452.1 hypothetical protein GM418_01920 [Maribellus comscasis]